MKNSLEQPIDLNSELFNQLLVHEQREIIFNHFYLMQVLCEFMVTLENSNPPEEITRYMNLLSGYAMDTVKYFEIVRPYLEKH